MIDWCTRFNVRLGIFTGIITLGLVGTILPDVFARSFLGLAIYGMSEASVMLLVFMVYLGLPSAQAKKVHFRVSIIDHIVSERLRGRLTAFRYLFCFCVCAAFTWYASIGALDSVLRNEQTYAVVPFPVWPARLAIAVGLALLTVQFLLDFVRILRGGTIQEAHEHGA